jgi:hypothetical protein
VPELIFHGPVQVMAAEDGGVVVFGPVDGEPSHLSADQVRVLTAALFRHVEAAPTDAEAEIEAAAANDELALQGVRPLNGAAH